MGDSLVDHLGIIKRARYHFNHLIIFMKIHTITFLLLIIGGLNWGLKAFEMDIGNYVPNSVAMVIYILVAASALYEVFSHKGLCRNCAPQGGM
jgi:uncharacterized membrane protein YuzA (DUF378 family)